VNLEEFLGHRILNLSFRNRVEWNEANVTTNGHRIRRWLHHNESEIQTRICLVQASYSDVVENVKKKTNRDHNLNGLGPVVAVLFYFNQGVRLPSPLN